MDLLKSTDLYTGKRLEYHNVPYTIVYKFYSVYAILY